MADQPLKLWTVVLEMEVPVLAATEDEAVRLGYQGMQDDMSEFDAYAFEHKTAHACGPANWDHESIVFAPRGTADMTLNEAIAFVFPPDPLADHPRLFEVTA